MTLLERGVDSRTYVRGQEVGEGRRPRLLPVVGGVLVFAVGAGLAASALREEPPPAPALPAAVEPVPDVPAEPAITEPSGSEEVPTFPPDGVTWSLFRGYALPSSAEAGPWQVDGALATGYAHTPTGALLAAANIDSRALLAREQWRAVVERQVMPGPQRDEYVRLRSQIADTAPAGELAQIVGFRFVHYSPELAVVELARRSPSGQLQTAPTTVRWDGSDWRLVFPEVDVEPWVIPSLVGFAPWAGVA